MVHQLTMAVVASLAEPQQGVVSRRQLLGAGVDPDLAARECRAGRWLRLTPGVYLTSPGPPTFLQLCHAARLHGGRRSAITGLAGAHLHLADDDTAPPAFVQLATPHEVRRVSTAYVRTTRSRTAPSVVPATQRADGLRVAPPDQCIADATALCTSLRDARATLCELLRTHGCGPAPVRARLQASRHHELALRAVADYERGARSAPEAEVADDFVTAAQQGFLPPFLLNPWVYVGDELLGAVDEWFVGLGLGNELDSVKHHGSQEKLDRTLLRHGRFADHHLRLDHTTPRRFRRHPQALVRRMGDLVVVRRALAQPEPADLRLLPVGPLLPLGATWPPGVRLIERAAA